VRHGEAEMVTMSKGFLELGFDSLAGIDLRNRLEAATGIRLPATLIFDYPSPAALTEFLLTELLPDIPQEEPAGEVDEGAIRRTIESISLASLREAGLLEALLRLAPIDPESAEPDRAVKNQSEMIKSMSAAELVRSALAVGDST
jgi:acyl carrier protein